MIEGQEGVSWDDWVRLARLTEEHGLEGLFRSDHYTAIIRPEADAHDAWATLAGLAAITERIRLGTMVSPATFRHPSVLARMAVTVDHISGGRVEVGMGSGWYEREHEAHGFPFLDGKQRFTLLAEQVEIVVRSWTEERFDHDGRAYRLRDQHALPRPLQQPHPPLILGGSVKPRFAALAAR
jgi:alkanesulfonate monooxygenase SsuD/methylene tetrahydromethanopterin reductase-like flavin-dependent oxidoreductase (luciferase family)